MKNPWTRKNPFLSMWLSGANAVAGRTAGSARGRAIAEGRRQATIVAKKSVKQITDFWTGGLAPPAPKKRKKRR